MRVREDGTAGLAGEEEVLTKFRHNSTGTGLHSAGSLRTRVYALPGCLRVARDYTVGALVLYVRLV